MLFGALSTIAGCSGYSAFTPGTATMLGAQSARGAQPAGSSHWKFSTLNNPNNQNFNALSGINNTGKITGYTGNGSGRDPHRGFVVGDYGKDSFRPLNYPGAVDTVATSLNNSKATAGWEVSKQGAIFGFILQGGVWTIYKDQKLRGGTSNVTELLGINDADLAVGFFTDEYGIDHAFELNATVGKFHGITPQGAYSAAATGINGKGDIVGWMTTQKGIDSCDPGPCKIWMLKGGVFSYYAFPRAKSTEPTGVNWQDQITGSFVDSANHTHGFLLSHPLGSEGWTQIDAPHSKGATVVTSVENHDYMVGYYIDDDKGNTNGFLATPQK
ncbi:MAG: hypothetical protein JOZ77_02235 [Candidatus Eremiobacteraeota bacterium]|nr:hypothetical protein [Candidatus Eremiobacteraeota bacterium]